MLDTSPADEPSDLIPYVPLHPANIRTFREPYEIAADRGLRRGTPFVARAGEHAGVTLTAQWFDTVARHYVVVAADPTGQTVTVPFADQPHPLPINAIVETVTQDWRAAGGGAFHRMALLTLRQVLREPKHEVDRALTWLADHHHLQLRTWRHDETTSLEKDRAAFRYQGTDYHYATVSHALARGNG